MRIERVGEVSVWWIDRPRGPRLTPRGAAIAAALAGIPCLALALWVHSRGEAVWPWSTVTWTAPSLPQYLLRYLYLLAGGVAYVVAVSVPRWRRLREVLRRDLEEASRFIEQGDFHSAALHLHRHVLLSTELRPRVRHDEVLDMDARIGPHLPPHRRLVVYYAQRPPALPESPQAGFEPRIVPVSVAGGWWTAGVVSVVAVAVLGHVAGALAAGDWRSLTSVNFIVEAVVLLGYGYVVFGGFLGRRAYFRFSPGVAELLRFKLRAGATRTESILLRRCDVFLDVTGAAMALSLVERASGRRIAEYELGRGRDVVETCLRAVLSSAPEHPLPRHELTV